LPGVLRLDALSSTILRVPINASIFGSCHARGQLVRDLDAKPGEYRLGQIRSKNLVTSPFLLRGLGTAAGQQLPRSNIEGTRPRKIRLGLRKAVVLPSEHKGQ
jgi:hypothetical protein